MSPRHFHKAMKTNVTDPKFKDMDLGPNLWYAFTRITGITNLFVYTPKNITDANKPVKK